MQCFLEKGGSGVQLNARTGASPRKGRIAYAPPNCKVPANLVLPWGYLMTTDQQTLYLVSEVHNFGGFFGGDTVTLTATPRGVPDDERTITIDQRALANFRDRHTISAGMLLALAFTADRVDRAELLG